MDTSRLEAVVAPHVRDCSFLELKRANDLETPMTGTRFGGQPYAEAGDMWPSCPTCRKELTFICQTRFSETRYVPPDGVALFTFFYCWECHPWGLENEPAGQWLVRFYSAPSDMRAVRMDRRTKDEHETVPCTVTISSARSLPDWEAIDTYCPEASAISAGLDQEDPWIPYERVAKQLTGRDDYATIVGGYPKWVQDEATPRCSQCGQLMEQFAQIDSEEEARVMWDDVGCAYLFCCRKHPSEIRFTLQSH